MTGILLIALSGLFHPLMALCPGMLILFYWLYYRKFREIALLSAGCMICFLVIFFFKDNPFSHTNIFAHLDEQWRQIIIEDGSCVVPGKWSWNDRLGVIGSLLLSVCSIRSLPHKLQKITSFLVILTVFGIIITLLSVYWLPWILPVQLQFWRAFWLLRLIIPAIGLIWAFHIWDESNGYALLAVPLLFISIIIEAGVTMLNFSWIILACCITILHKIIPQSIFVNNHAKMQKPFWGPFKNDGFIKTILLIEILLVVLLFFIMVGYQRTNFIETTTIHAFLYSLTAFLGPLFRPFFFVGPCLIICFLIKKNRYLGLLLIPIFFYLIIPTRLPFFHTPAIVEINRPQRTNDAIVKKLNTWRNLIEPGGVIYTDGSIPVDLIWFHLYACGYVSRMQKGGLVFSRDIAIEFNKRKQDIIVFNELYKTDELLSWCRKNKIDYIISARNLPLFRLGKIQNISLYSIR